LYAKVLKGYAMTIFISGESSLVFAMFHRNLHGIRSQMQKASADGQGLNAGGKTLILLRLIIKPL
jgi:hypothetical protein